MRLFDDFRDEVDAFYRCVSFVEMICPMPRSTAPNPPPTLVATLHRIRLPNVPGSKANIATELMVQRIAACLVKVG